VWRVHRSSLQVQCSCEVVFVCVNMYVLVQVVVSQKVRRTDFSSVVVESKLYKYSYVNQLACVIK